MLALTDIAWSAAGRPVIAGLDLVVAPAELVVMLGASGVGKTTVLRLAAGLTRPDRGEVNNGFRRTSMVFQEPRLMPWASARDNVALVPTVASQMSINAVQMLLPMQFAASIARSVSPITAVIVAVSGIAKVSPFDVVKRTAIPMAGAMAANIVAGFFLIN